MSRSKIIEEKTKLFLQVLNEFPEFTYAGDPILHATTTEVGVKEGIVIGKNLGKILIRYRQIAGIGRGLAAPQIGISKSVFVTFVNDELQTFINPKIVEFSKESNLYKELCLSSGTMAAEVQRPSSIVMTWMDEKGEPQKQKFEGFLARLYQHEEEHLRGIINLDHAEPGGIEFTTFDPLKEQLREISYVFTKGS